MRKYLSLFFKPLKKPALLVLSLLIFFLIGLLSFSKPLSIELKADSKLKKQAGFSKKETQILSYLEKYKNQFLWQTPLKKIAQNIEKQSLGFEVYVHRKYPNRLIVSLHEKQTALLLLKGGNSFYSVSYDGSLGAEKKTQNLPYAPILRGASFESNQILRKKALELLEPIPKQDLLFSIENISEILYDKKQNSFLIYLSTRPLAVKLNSPPSGRKIKNIEFVLEYLKKEGKDHSVIDARSDKKIICQKKDLNLI